MAGDKRLAYPTGSTTIDRFLDSALKIDLDNVLEKKSIIESITEPAKGQLTYEKEAVNKILWHSGKNLYFLQLICHYIVEFLNKKNRTHCMREDVEKVAFEILSDESDEFREIWGKKFPIEFKLIASAVADESITERESSVFSFKKNVLLDTILGKRMSKEIEKLHALGYIKQMYGRHFTDFPFRIPMYGQWIQRTYPFLKTVVENIELIADKVDFDILMEEIGKAHAGKLNLFNKSLVLETAKQWRLLTEQIMEKQRNVDKTLVENFLESLSRLLSINITARWQPNQDYFILDIRSLKIGIMEEVFCFIQDRPELTADDVHKIERKASVIAEDTQTKLTLFFYFQDSEQLKNLVRKTYLNLVAVQENDLKIILLSNRPQEIFRNLILSRLSLQSISPFQTEGPAKATFYGRKNIINRITGSPGSSFSIVGTRKIGKSSLLYKIKDDPPEGTIYIFMNLELEFHRGKEIKNYGIFLKRLEKEIEKTFKKKVDLKKFPFGRTISKIPDVIRGLPRGENKIVFIFDEIDGLLEFDKKNGYKLMITFRTLSQDGSCQFIFAGFKELYNTRRKIENPMYNFCEEIILDPLDDEAALYLTTKPMESIGIRYKNPEDRNLILEFTARHPNLMQFFCQQLVKKVEKHSRIEDRRTIFEEDVHDLFGEEYKEYIMDEVYMVFSDLSDINLLILMLLTEDSQKEKRYFTTFEIKDLLANCDIDLSIRDVHWNLRELVVRFILIDEGDENYRFALPVFPGILRRTVDKDFKIKTIKEIIRR
jgi:hypothetical protein